MHIIQSERLLLRELRPSDVPALVELLATPVVMRWLFAGVTLDRDDAMTFIQRDFTFGKAPFGLGVLVLRETGEAIGFAGLLTYRRLGAEDFEFGFTLRESAWGQGYATEIGRAQIAYGFGELGAERLLALVHPDNKNSRKALEKIGMRLFREIGTHDRGPRCVYVIDRPS
jgi:[ribosomal protein S5]-alanine N-acetyltransferase